ncbi:uncharacterized protein LOC123988222 [Osmia bicornis bicornis]|uniref:uncharacterized protein LOC123988222 n=1 Tax=Osmia bicornis bicornis TaxID=1437191 RepID=UPI001EAF845A|nr:uncharacterized protein LOC123988222 [Osmia bicornis bicornis]
MRERMLDLFNLIWKNGCIPKAWKRVVIKFLKKPGKKALRPISLICCLGKILERLVKDRLGEWADVEEIVDHRQSGFTKGKSTMDNLVALTIDIKRGFREKKDTCGVFVDVKSAYDHVNHNKLIDLLKRRRCPKLLINFLTNWLKDRSALCSRKYRDAIHGRVERGLPQGSVLSPILYNIYTSEICRGMEQEGVKVLLYADDIVVYVMGDNLNNMKGKIERAVDILLKNLNKLGLSLAEDKSKVVIFTRSRDKRRMEGEFRIGREWIKNEEQVTFLGMILDRALNYRKHIEMVKDRVKKKLDILRFIVGIKKGVKPGTMLIFFKGLIRSVIEYGLFVYFWDNIKSLKKIMRLHNAGIRIAMGYRITTPINVMNTEAGIMDLESRAEALLERFVMRQRTRGKGVVFEALLRSLVVRDEVGTEEWDPWTRAWYKAEGIAGRILKEGVDRESSNRERDFLEKGGILVDWESGKERKTATFSDSSLSIKVKERLWPGINDEEIIEIFTDGSKKDFNEVVGAGLVYRDREGVWQEESWALNKITSVFSAEAFAILQAVKKARANWGSSKIVIFTDSASVLKKLMGFPRRMGDNPWIKKIVNEMMNLELEYKRSENQLLGLPCSGNRLGFAWIPSHVGIEGNERADIIAGDATYGEETYEHGIVEKDAMNYIMNSAWVRNYDRAKRKGDFKGIKYFRMEKNNVGSKKPWFDGINGIARGDLVKLSRIRANHFNLGESLFRKNLTNMKGCICGAALESIEHVIWECDRFWENREELDRFLISKGFPEGADVIEMLMEGDLGVIKRIARFLNKLGKVI